MLSGVSLAAFSTTGATPAAAPALRVRLPPPAATAPSLSLPGQTGQGTGMARPDAPPGQILPRGSLLNLSV